MSKEQPPQWFHIPMMFRVEAPSCEDAARLLHESLDRLRDTDTVTNLRTVTRPGRPVEAVKEWWLPEPDLHHVDGNTHTGVVIREPDALTAVFGGSPIPDILARIFPPEPKAADYLNADGQPDQERYEEAYELWQEAA